MRKSKREQVGSGGGRETAGEPQRSRKRGNARYAKQGVRLGQQGGGGGEVGGEMILKRSEARVGDRKKAGATESLRRERLTERQEVMSIKDPASRTWEIGRVGEKVG